jgi:2-methylcitrate dehydratase PrpD
MSVVTAALLASASRVRASPQDLLTALCVGVDIACGLGIACRSGLRFFRPATAGLMGACLAVARLESLAPERWPDVLGLAYSQVAGTMQAHVEGSIALPLQVANAARAAIAAVDLARAGLSGPHDVLEGPFGYFGLIESESDLAPYLGGLGAVWRIAEISHKPYPSGRASHAVLSTLKRVQAREGFAAGDVAAVEAHVPPLIQRLVGRPWSEGMTPAYARLCLPFLISLMLTDQRIHPPRFTDRAFNDPALRALGAKLSVQLDGNSDPNALSPQRLVVRLNDGRVFDEAIAHTLGAPNNPLSEAEHFEKVQDCLSLSASAFDHAALIRDPLGFLGSDRASTY